MVGEDSEGVLSADVFGVTCHCPALRRWGAGGGGFALCSRLLTLGALGGVGGRDAASVGIHVFFIGRARLGHCAIVAFQCFLLLHATHVGELCPIIAKPVPCESHPEWTRQF